MRTNQGASKSTLHKIDILFNHRVSSTITQRLIITMSIDCTQPETSTMHSTSASTNVEQSDLAQQHFYREIVALNNIGVGLLELHAYKQALDTFKDAAELIKLRGVFGAKTTPASSDLSSTQYDPSRQAEASRRFAKPEPMIHVTVTHANEAENTALPSTPRTPVQLRVVSHSSMWSVDSFSNGNMLGGMATTSIAYPIRIDGSEPEYFDTIRHRSLDLEAAICLHNLAISYLCLSSVIMLRYRDAKSPRQKERLFRQWERLRESSKRVFCMTHQILMCQEAALWKRINEEAEMDDDNELLHFTMLVQIHMYGLINSVQLHMELGDDETAQDLYGHLSHLRNIMAQLDEEGAFSLFYGSTSNSLITKCVAPAA